MTAQAETKTSQQRTHDVRGMLPIALGTLLPAERLAFDLFMRSDENEAALFRGRGYPLDQQDIDQLIESNVPNVYIKVAEREAFGDYLREVALENPALIPEGRFKVFTEANRSVFKSALRSGDTSSYVQFAQSVGGYLTEIICSDAVTISDLSPFMSHDYDTLTHVANVTTYCVLLAAALGNDDREVLREIAVGGLLHDYGKRFISSATLNSPGKLTSQQFLEIQQHPRDGFCQFAERDDVTWGQLMMIYQHHERPDGKGYPVGVRGDHIHPWARICKVADVYDDFTSDRPHRKANSPFESLTFMQKRVGSEFDKGVFECFRAMINYKD